MKKFWIKMCSLVLLLFLIGGYNTVLAIREQRDEIARNRETADHASPAPPSSVLF